MQWFNHVAIVYRISFQNLVVTVICNMCKASIYKQLMHAFRGRRTAGIDICIHVAIEHSVKNLTALTLILKFLDY